MPHATFTGPHRLMTFRGLTFLYGEPRPVAPEIAADLRAHPWFSVDADEGEAVAPASRPRGRPRKVSP